MTNDSFKAYENLKIHNKKTIRDPALKFFNFLDYY
jgi:hypothetical protein